MVYGHYWGRQRVIDLETYNKIITDFKLMIPVLELNNVMLHDWDGEGAPTFDYGLVRFNGTKEPNHDDFCFDRALKPNDPNDPEECKEDAIAGCWCITWQKPYDLAVVIFLVIAKHYLREKITIISNGEICNFQPGMKLIHSTLGYGLDFALDLGNGN